MMRKVIALVFALITILPTLLSIISLAAPQYTGSTMVSTRTYVIGARDLSGGGRIRWTVTGSDANILRGKIIDYFDAKENGGDGDGKLDIPELRSKTAGVKGYLWMVEEGNPRKKPYGTFEPGIEGQVYCGVMISGSEPYHASQIGQNLDVDVKGLINTDKDTDAIIDISYTCNAYQGAQDMLVPLISTKMCDALYTVFPNGYDDDKACEYNSLGMLRSQNSWESLWHVTLDNNDYAFAWNSGSVYEPNRNDSLVYQYFNLSSLVSPALIITHRASFAQGDYGAIEGYINGEWRLLRRYDGKFGIRTDTISLRRDMTAIRFRCYSDDRDEDEGWFIHKIAILDSIPGVVINETMEGTTRFDTNEWALTRNESHSGNYSLTDSPGGNYTPGGVSWTKIVVNYAGAARLHMTFWHKYEFAENDVGNVYVRFGNSAKKVDVFSGSSDWDIAEYDIVCEPSPNATVIFEIMSNGASAADGWYIDDFNLQVYRGVLYTNCSNIDGWITSNADQSQDFWSHASHADGKSVWRWNASKARYVSNTLYTSLPIDLRFVENCTVSFEYRGRLSGESVTVYLGSGGEWREYRVKGVGNEWNVWSVDASEFVGVRSFYIRIVVEGSVSAEDFLEIRSLRVYGPVYTGNYVIKHTQYIVGLGSYMNPKISKGHYFLIRTPAGEILSYSVSLQAGEEPQDKITYRSFDYLENPQILFIVAFILFSLILHYPRKFYYEYKASIPLRYRRMTRKLMYVHAPAYAFAAILMLFYFFAGFATIFISGLYIWIMGVIFVVCSYALSKYAYAAQVSKDRKRIWEEGVKEKVAEKPSVHIAMAAPQKEEKKEEEKKKEEKKMKVYQCEKCGEIFEVPEEYKEARCPACGAIVGEGLKKIEVSVTEGDIERGYIKCPDCGARVSVEKGMSEVLCPRCHTVLVLKIKSLDTGYNYILLDKSPERAFKIFAKMAKDYPALCISTTYPDKLTREYGIENAKILWISSTESEMAINPKRLDFEITRGILQFMKDNENAIILIDGIEYLVVENGFEAVLKFLKKIIDMSSVKGATLLVPVNPTAFSEEEITILSKEFDRVEDFMSKT